MQFERARRRLLDQLDAIDSPEAAMAFQRALASELRAAEKDANTEVRWHGHLLRLMGDALARQLLSRHTLRELSRDWHPAPSLTGQGEDFDFVLEVAEQTVGPGFVPLISDLTHLITVGGLISVGPSSIAIIECKNRKMPTGWGLRGRHARQLQRQSEAASYLTSGHVPDGNGKPRIALEVDEPRPREEELQDCVGRASASATGSAAAQLGDRDFLIACWERGLQPQHVLPRIDTDGWRFPAIAGSATAAENPAPFIANAYSLPLPADARHAVAEGDLLLLRLVDLGLLTREHEAGSASPSVEVYRKGGSCHLRAVLDGGPVELSQRFIDQVIWNFWSAADTSSMIMACLEAVQAAGRGTPGRRIAAAAPEVPTLAGFAYRGPDASAGPVFVSRLSDLARVGVSVPYEEFEAFDVGTEPVSVSAVIERQGQHLRMRLDDASPADDSSG
ncbi:MAG TPA: hypothetical protein VIY52_07835 [Streptosporangiaceae bacterium]